MMCFTCKGAGEWPIGDCEDGLWETCSDCEGRGETMTTCEANSHRLEFREFNGGEEQYICLDCGETIIRYVDNHGC